MKWICFLAVVVGGGGTHSSSKERLFGLDPDDAEDAEDSRLDGGKEESASLPL